LPDINKWRWWWYGGYGVVCVSVPWLWPHNSA